MKHTVPSLVPPESLDDKDTVVPQYPWRVGEGRRGGFRSLERTGIPGCSSALSKMVQNKEDSRLSVFGFRICRFNDPLRAESW